MAQCCFSTFWPRSSQEVENYPEKGCSCGISGLAGHRKDSDLREKHVYAFFCMCVSQRGQCWGLPGGLQLAPCG